MLRAACRALSSVRAQAVAQAPVSVLRGRGSAGPPSARCGLWPPSLLPAARAYTTQKPVQLREDNEPPPSMLIKDYKDIIPGMEKVDDVVKRILSLEMANQKEKLKIKQELLMNKIAANPADTRSLEARIVALTVKIRNYEEHMQKHQQDKAHKRFLQMSIDQRRKMLKNLRQTNYEVFEKTCRELGIEYTIPPLHPQKVHRRYLAKKALCIQVYQTMKKLKKQRKALNPAAAAAAAAAATPKQDNQKNPGSPSQALSEVSKENQ